jgi:uncharacterized protein YbaR (Trm112 family)
MAKKVIEIVCANPECKKEFTIFKEEKGTHIVYCTFCGTEQKIVFEKKEEHEIYRGNHR